jgi:phage terminase small subunit
MANLTANQENFARLVAQGKNQTEAYKLAYDTSGYTNDNAISVEASRLVDNPQVSLMISELKKPAVDKVKAHIIKNSLPAAETLTNVATNPDNKDNYKAAKIVLDYAGYAPVEKSIDVTALMKMDKDDIEKLLQNLS